MGWNPAELGRRQFLILSTQGGMRAPDGRPVALGYHTGHWEIGLLAQAVHGRGQALGPVSDRPGRVERARAEDVVVDLADLLEVRVRQHRLRDLELVRVLGEGEVRDKLLAPPPAKTACPAG